MPPDSIKHLWKIQDYCFNLNRLAKPFVLILRSKLCNQTILVTLSILSAV